MNDCNEKSINECNMLHDQLHLIILNLIISTFSESYSYLQSAISPDLETCKENMSYFS